MLRIDVTPEFDRVELLFSAPAIDRLWDPMNRLLLDIHGVEQVKLKRYSGRVEVATHVAHPEDIAGEIFEAFARGELGEECRSVYHHLHVVNYSAETGDETETYIDQIVGSCGTAGPVGSGQTV